MKTKLHSIIRICRAALATAAVLYFAAYPAVAATTTPLSCTGGYGEGGCPPKSQLTYNADPGGGLYEYGSAPLSYSVNGLLANVYGAVDLAAGSLKASAEGTNTGFSGDYYIGSMGAYAWDVFTLHSASSGTASITASLAAGGSGFIGNRGGAVNDGETILTIGVPSSGGIRGSTDKGQYKGGVNAPLGETFSLFSTEPGKIGDPLSASTTLGVEYNVPFLLYYSLFTQVRSGTLMDLSHTANLNFTLADGESITSMGGYGLSTVPLPGAVWLFGVGLLGLAGLRRRKCSAA